MENQNETAVENEESKSTSRRVDKETTVKSFTAALREKYCFDEEENCAFIVSSKNVTVFGKSATGGAKMELARLKNVVLSKSNLTHAGLPPEGLASLCPNVVDLDISLNNLTSWREIIPLFYQLAHLKYVNLTKNKIKSDQEYLDQLEKPLENVQNLVLNHTDIPWTEVLKLAKKMPVLKELHVCNNGYEVLSTVEEDTLKNIECLRVNDNNIKSWSEVWKLRHLGNLQSLILSGNPVQDVFYEHGCCPPLLASSVSKTIDVNLTPTAPNTKQADNCGDRADKSGDRADNSGDRADNSGDRTDNSGDRADISGDKADNCGDKADNSGDRADNCGDKADNSGDRADNSGDKADNSGDKADNSGDRADNSGDKADNSGDRADISGDKADNSGDRADISGDKADNSGDRADNSGDRADNSGDRAKNQSCDNSQVPSSKQGDDSIQSENGDVAATQKQTSLSLSEHEGEIRKANTCCKPFKNLNCLCLTETSVHHSDHLEALTQFPSLKSVRLQDIALYSNESAEDRRRLLIASLPNIETFNGSKVSSTERVNSERFYIRYFLDKDENPKRKDDLEKTHGKLKKVVDIYIGGTFHEFATLQFYINQEKKFEKKLRLRDRVDKLRTFVADYLKVSRSSFKLYHFPCGPDHKYMDFEFPQKEQLVTNIPLSRLNFCDGDEIHIDTTQTYNEDNIRVNHISDRIKAFNIVFN